MGYWYRLYDYAKSWGLNDYAAALYVVLSYRGWEYHGQQPLAIISGYRSADRQAQLRVAWDAGRREGLAVRPALRSAHTEARAFDLSGSNKQLGILGQIAYSLDGTRWGGNFRESDPGHFETGVDGWKAW